MKRTTTQPVRILYGDNRETLKKHPKESVHMWITSPPYWSVRDYETPPVDYPAVTFRPAIGLPKLRVPAWSGQLGLEPDPWAFIGHLVLSFRAAWRTLRNDGTLWVNIGDTHYTGAGKAERPGGGRQGQKGREIGPKVQPNRLPIDGMKPKDLVGIPWMLAKALQAEGWTLRSDIIWHKPSPMPESAKDRPTTAHEYLFLFSKAERYFYDAEAIKEKVTGNAHPRGHGVNPKAKVPTGWDTRAGSHTDMVGRYPKARQNESFSAAVRNPVLRRNKRSVWTIASKGFDGAHFATFPPDLVRPCVLAGTSEKGACGACGKPWIRCTLPAGEEPPDPAQAVMPEEITGPTPPSWRPDCECGAPVVPCVVGDLFAGSGTVGEVAIEYGRHALLCELAEHYLPLIKQRTTTTPPLLTLA